MSTSTFFNYKILALLYFIFFNTQYSQFTKRWRCFLSLLFTLPKVSESSPPDRVDPLFPIVTEREWDRRRQRWAEM